MGKMSEGKTRLGERVAGLRCFRKAAKMAKEGLPTGKEKGEPGQPDEFDTKYRRGDQGLL